MKNIVEAIKKTGVFFIATVDEGQPRVRPFGSVTEYNGKIYICTNNTKDVFKQIEKNNKIEICGMVGEGEWIRVTAEAIRDADLDAKKAILEDPTGPSYLYKYDDPIFEVFYLENPKCIKYSFTSDLVEIK